jgi:3-dehydroquinate synthase
MAEVIKYGVIWDGELFTHLEQAQRLDQMQFIDVSLLQEILQRSCQSKAEVVSKDEKELGLRAILNYGHTIGHAVESLTGYTTVLHGEAVGIGMVAASRIAVKLGLWDEDCDRRQLGLIQKAGLPTKLPTGINIDEILASLQLDKKVENKKVRFILPTEIGVVTITDQVSSEVIREVLQGMF